MGQPEHVLRDGLSGGGEEGPLSLRDLLSGPLQAARGRFPRITKKSFAVLGNRDAGYLAWGLHRLFSAR